MSAESTHFKLYETDPLYRAEQDAKTREHEIEQALRIIAAGEDAAQEHHRALIRRTISRLIEDGYVKAGTGSAWPTLTDYGERTRKT